MKVRRAEPRDADAIAAVWLGAWRTAYRGLVPDEVLAALSLSQRQELWRGRLARGEPALVAERDGRVAGYCRSLPGEIASLYVEPRGRGVGAALLTAALAELDTPDVTLWVFAENGGARRFYARFGFEPDGARGIDGGTGLLEVRLRAVLRGQTP